MPSADITRLWNTFRPVDRAFPRLIIGDLPLLADSPIDWTLLRTAISFWDTQQAVFSFQGSELAPTVEEYAALIQQPMPTRDIVVPNQFATIQSRLAILLDLRDEEIRHDDLPSEGQGHLRALHIVCKCNNHIVSRVMIDNGSALNVCPVSTLKQMNVDMSRIRASKTTVRAFDGSRREVNGEIDLLKDVGPCSFSVTFQILEIPNAFSLLLGRPWIHAAGAVPSSLHQKLKFFVEGKLITVNGEEDYGVYKETVVPYISIGEDQNLPFHSFDTISVIRDYGEVGPSRTDRMIGKVLLKNDYVPGIGLGARAQGILRPIEMEEYRNRRGLGFRPSLLHITESSSGAFRGKFAYKYNGPFIVKEVFDGGTIILNDMDGNENALPVNADALKKYYP
ncbi:hypothetical protein CRG98_015698 [Punica granatum]|uniref:G-patch domain-containing protein n=1 Tax=Punica granatum TaxID=22663 RepID=A0A2I0K5V2_PUNGR|nr:hypothetical protein CRG98_015698 [Punica granatum]